MKKSSLIRAYQFKGFRTKSMVEIIDNGFAVDLVRRQKKQRVAFVEPFTWGGMTSAVV